MTGSTARSGRLRRSVVLVVWLTGVWLALWGDINGRNLVGGVLLAVVLVLCFAPDRSEWLVVRPLAALRFLAHFGVNLVRSSLRLVGVVLRPSPGPVGAVIAVDVPSTTPAIVTVVVLSISLTPGTLVLESRATAGGTRLYVHVLDARQADRDRADIEAVERLATRAFGTRTQGRAT